MIVQARKESNGSTVLTVMVDTLDRTNAPEFKVAAMPGITPCGGSVEVDCARLEFIDSSGVGAFLHIQNQLPERWRPLRLTRVGSKVLTVLELMQVHKVFDLVSGN